jgi:hypothetical protein
VSYHSRGCAIPNASARNDFDPACTCGQAARAAAYCKVEPTAHELELGRALARAGYCQVSRKYRRVVFVPPCGALDELQRVAPDEAERLRVRIAEYAESQARALLWHHGETRELDAGTFEAFRRARLEAGEAFP